MLNISKIEISYDKLLARLGYFKSKTIINDKIVTLIKENLNLVQKIIRPKIVVAFEKIKLAKDKVYFENGYIIESNNVVKLLKNCFKVYGICATIGNAVESKRDEFLKQRETFNALILDAAGSVAAEEVVTVANLQIKIYEEKNGNILTKRYSPGYGDWMLEANGNFLDWIGAEQIGVSFNEFFHMKPEKSVSALIGVR
jgi:hypothetical protein